MTSQTIYPRTYQYHPIVKVLGLLLCAAAVGAGAVTLFLAGDWIPDTPWLLQAGGVGLIGLGLFGARMIMAGRVVLYADRLDYHGSLGSRTVRREAILTTYNMTQQYGFTSITLKIRDGGSLTINDYGRGDQVWRDWFDSLPNAEVEEARVKAERQLANSAFGATALDRECAIAIHKRILQGLVVAGYAAAAWAWFRPQPYSLVVYIVMAFPVVIVALAAIMRRQWEIFDSKASDRLGIGQAILVPAAALFVRALLDIDLMDWKAPMVVVAGAAVACAVVLALVDGKARPVTLGWALIACAAYGWAGAVQLNNLLDRAEPHTYPVQVLDMRVSSGKTTTYYLTLSAWGPRPSGNEITVAQELYDDTAKGATLCMFLYPGRFGWPYELTGHCPKDVTGPSAQVDFTPTAG